MDKQTTQPATNKPAPAPHYTPETSQEFKDFQDVHYQRSMSDFGAGYHRTTW
jgi:hypothetical protein